MTHPGGSLTDLFRDFYSRVAAAHRDLEAVPGGVSPEDAQAPLLAVLESIASGAEDRYATDSLSLQQARYLMACFADDQLGRGDGPGAVAWRGSTLESRLFQSEEGGTEVFRRIDKLLEIGDPGRRDLAAAYLLAVALGFRGRYADADGERPLRDYRRRLLGLAAPERQGDDAARWITPSAYSHTLGRVRAALLPGLGTWAWIAGGAVLLLFLVSYLIFSEETAAIATTVTRILGRGQAP